MDCNYTSPLTILTNLVGLDLHEIVIVTANNLSEIFIKSGYLTLLSAEVVISARIELPLRII